jgi:hypothetical protein
MKKIMLFLPGFLFAHAVFAQNYWTLSGTNIYNNNTGNVGIGVTNPAAPLHVAAPGHPSFCVGLLNSSGVPEGNMANTVAQIQSSISAVAYNSASTSTNGAVAWNYYNNGTSPSWSGALLQYSGTAVSGNLYGVTAANQGAMIFQNVSNGVIASNGANIIISPNSLPTAYFLANGSVGIGTSNTYSYSLAVNGSAIFTEAVVKLNANWPDYVFEKDFRLPSLKSVAEYARINGHLPGMPSAESVAKSGIDLGSTEAKLLEKIEELTLYTAELQKKVEKLETANQALEAAEDKLESIQQQIDALKKRGSKL